MITAELINLAQLRVPPSSAMQVLRLSLLDWCAVAIAGRDEPVARILRDQALCEGGQGQASLVGSATRVPARMAALVNGATSHALDYDDTHFSHIGHPSVAVIPAALATAQISGASGRAMQEAALIGAEASVRVGVWLGRSHYQIGFHQTATAGAYGATIAACRLFGLTREQTAMAIGLVSTRASGLKSQFGTMGKPMNAGIAASNGVEAAILARNGFVSNPDALDCLQGFGATHAGEGQIHDIADIKNDWFFNRVSHKFHACCHGLHAMLEALSTLIGTDPAMIKRIEITTHPRWLTVCNNPHPATGLEAKFSYPMTAAMRVLGYDTAHPQSFGDHLCQDVALTALQGKVSVQGSENISEMQSSVLVSFRDGTEQKLKHDLSHQPSLGDRRVKVREKASVLLGKDAADTLWHAIDTLAGPEEIAELLN